MKMPRRLLAAFLLGGSLLALPGCGSSGPKASLEAELGKLGGDADAKVNALNEIAQLGGQAAPAVPKLMELLKDPDPVVLRTAAYALGSIGPKAKAAIPALKAILDQSNDRDTLTATVNAIRAIDEKAVEGVRVENTSN
ncbi:MAG: HEAT repeat domain-containing protein [Verrucomicrobiota bacterium]